jgi:hypothetical protein
MPSYENNSTTCLLPPSTTVTLLRIFLSSFYNHLGHFVSPRPLLLQSFSGDLAPGFVKILCLHLDISRASFIVLVGSSPFLSNDKYRPCPRIHSQHIIDYPFNITGAQRSGATDKRRSNPSEHPVVVNHICAQHPRLLTASNALNSSAFHKFAIELTPFYRVCESSYVRLCAAKGRTY